MSEIQNSDNISVERIIAKIDNDFNPDNSDWIPRVGAWCMDAMSQLNCLKTETKRKTLKVTDRIAYSETDLDGSNIKVYDENGCRVKELKDVSSDGCIKSINNDNKKASKGSLIRHMTPNTVAKINTGNPIAPNYVKADTINAKYPYRYNIHLYTYGNERQNQERNYVLADTNKIELNFDTDSIDVETEYVASSYSDKYGCELPSIPNNGSLIEAITMFCMYKMLTRGYKHPVMNLMQSQYGTNPYYMWTQMKEQVEREVNNNNLSDDDLDEASRLMRSGMIIEDFDGRR